MWWASVLPFGNTATAQNQARHPLPHTFPCLRDTCPRPHSTTPRRRSTGARISGGRTTRQRMSGSLSGAPDRRRAPCTQDRSPRKTAGPAASPARRSCPAHLQPCMDTLGVPSARLSFLQNQSTGHKARGEGEGERREFPAGRRACAPVRLAWRGRSSRGRAPSLASSPPEAVCRRCQDPCPLDLLWSPRPGGQGHEAVVDFNARQIILFCPRTRLTPHTASTAQALVAQR